MSIKTNLGKYVAASVYAATVGTAAQVVNGLATHTTIQGAHDAVSAGSAVLILVGATTGALNCTKNIAVFGQGWGSQISGTVTMTNTCNFCTFKNVRFMANVTINSGSVGHQFMEYFRATGVVITDQNPTRKSNLNLGIGEA